jgi:hypothetical protein
LEGAIAFQLEGVGGVVAFAEGALLEELRAEMERAFDAGDFADSRFDEAGHEGLAGAETALHLPFAL